MAQYGEPNATVCACAAVTVNATGPAHCAHDLWCVSPPLFPARGQQIGALPHTAHVIPIRAYALPICLCSRPAHMAFLLRRFWEPPRRFLRFLWGRVLFGLL